ncbi:hypothetical protein SteCoe_34358 [Stentor coeruleus]|uniref:Uncharacterized protein n=1 Tax=Stentor coeruleus TaxID=5963 RepID=A0A1R2AUV5_9CILI|nr:hypothetical protein SteCoe_34358 [Stentor coeruleus]
MAVVCSSARGLLCQFKHNNPEIKAFALQKLNEVVDYCWHEIAKYLPDIQNLALDGDYDHHELAAFLASQVHYHLENYKEALMLALESGDLFDISQKSDFVQTLVSHCINQYISAEVKNYSARNPEDRIEISKKMKFVVEKMFERCFADREFKQAIGISIESRRLDKLEESIIKSGDSRLLKYTYEIVRDIVLPKEFRREIVVCLVKLHMTKAHLDFASVSEYKFFINDPEALAMMLEELISHNALFAYQLCLDLVENQKQGFLNELSQHLSKGQVSPIRTNVLKILTGAVSIELTLHFLQTKSNTDKQLVNKIKTSVDTKSSVTHGSVIFANAFMCAGTADDSFLRENLSWVAKATNWGKFSAVACLGVIHRGNVTKSMEILKPYLPSETNASTGSQAYSEGGALYALGLIHCNFIRPDIQNFIDRALSLNSNSEPIQHGGCLGLGLLSMGSGSREIYDKFKSIVFNDKANSGEAAAYGIGMVMLGSANENAIGDIITYAHETQHEKIIRGLGISLALIMYKREEESDALITQLITDKDPILRYGGMYTMATAYIGTANTNVVKKLLHFAVSDVDYDVRKAAVTAIGFVLCRLPEQVPKVVALLSESYNPYVRQGAAMAIGIACAGNPIPEALGILENLLSDSTNFVRQAAFVAMAMVLIQSNKGTCPRVEKFREKIDKIMTEKNQDVLTKMGAIVSLGILDAGGRNVTISLDSSSGNNRAPATVGIILALQFWYWFPMLHMISLSFKPTCLLAIDQNLAIVPSFTFVSAAKPSLYAYPPKLELPTNEKSGKVSTAVLSTTNKVKARAAAKRGEKSMEVEENKQEVQEEKKTEVKDEPSEEVLKNPSRVLPVQAKVIQFIPDSRWEPVIKRNYGFLVLKEVKNESKMQSFEVETEIPEEFVFDPEVQKHGK